MPTKEEGELIPIPVTSRKGFSCRPQVMLSSIARKCCYGILLLIGVIIIFQWSTINDYRLSHLSSNSGADKHTIDLLTDEPTNTTAQFSSGASPLSPSESGSYASGEPEALSQPNANASPKTPVHDYSKFESSAKPPVPKSTEALEFWRRLTNILDRGRPSFPEAKRKDEDGIWLFFNRHHYDRERPQFMDLSDAEFQELRDLRSAAVEDIKKLSGQLPYIPGTRGIVTTAPGNAFGMLTTSLWMLRKSGSTLPVEIWLYDESEYEKVPCEVIFPSFNAKCMLMRHYLPGLLEHPLNIVKFTYKPLATLFSTFEEFIFLDDDVFPVMNPDPLLESEPFVSNGMLLWPDYWADTASADFYEMSGLPVPEMTERATTESGQFLIRKSTHAPALLMSAWFNTWGPEYWHRLVSQKSPGEGDKDLWKFSAMAFDLEYAQVEQQPQRVGYICGDGKNIEDEHPIGSAHSHPMDDLKITEAGLPRDRDDALSFGTSTHPRIQFIHANLPKLDPNLLLDWNLLTPGWHTALRCDNGTGPAHRLYGPPELTIPKYGWDMEKGIWNAMLWMSCKHERDFSYWTTPNWWKPKPRTDLCKSMQVYWEEHFPDEEWDQEPPTHANDGVIHPWGEHEWQA